MPGGGDQGMWEGQKGSGGTNHQMAVSRSSPWHPPIRHPSGGAGGQCRASSLLGGIIPRREYNSVVLGRLAISLAGVGRGCVHHTRRGGGKNSQRPLWSGEYNGVVEDSRWPPDCGSARSGGKADGGEAWGIAYNANGTSEMPFGRDGLQGTSQYSDK
eukprot:GGOE01053456.1.p1 GENE.GGOE01053456.1~~GGOE01053456.1.p1  ORF type:complete len:158 (-),score=1.29 GGOE01053456.1:226-699(-)